MTQKLLAVRQDNNGDVLLAGPALRALATAGDVTLVCGPGGAPAARILPDVAEVIVARAAWIEGRPAPLDVPATHAFVARIAASGFARAFVFTSFHQSPLPMALLLRLAGVPFVAAISVDYAGSLLDARVVDVPDDIHESERALALVRACGHALPPGDDGALRCATLPRDAGLGLARETYVVVQPGATVPARAWAPSRWRDLVATLARRGERVVIAGSAAERDLAAYVSGDADVLDASGRTSFAQFAASVRDARAVIVGNTSGIHVASAVGTPVVTIFPPTIPAVRFAPYRVPHAILGDQRIGCAGCRARACPIPDQPCTSVVTDADVVAALDALRYAEAVA